MSIIEAFLTATVTAIQKGDGEALARLLSIPEDFTEDRYRQLLPALELTGDPVPSHLWSRLINRPSYNQNDDDEVMLEIWPEVIRQFLGCLKLYRKASIQGAAIVSCKRLFSAWLSLAQTYLRILQAGGERWHLQLLYGILDELWQLAKQAADESSINSSFSASAASSTSASSGNEEEEAARLVNKAFTICITDRNPVLAGSRKWGTYRVAGLLFRIYFGLGQLALCNNALRAIGASQLPDLEDFPAAHRVTYQYYLGRYYFVNEKYAQACQELQMAFKECHRDALTAKRKILHLLIPTRLLVHGAIPSLALLERYKMDSTFYSEALASIISGNVRAYRSLLECHEHDLLLMGTFLIWERLVLVANRSLVRRICVLQEGNTRIALGQLVTLLGAEEVDEVGAILAALIDTGLVKGYISQERATLVLSQKDPFPPISSCKLCR